MKKTISLLVLLLAITILHAQQPLAVNNPFPKTISVSGSAEMQIIPDQIFVNIELKEYQKKGESKRELEPIKQQFLDACRAAGIPDSAISIASYSGYNNYYALRRRKKNTDLFAGIVYQVMFRNSQAMDALVEKLDDEATENFQIASTSHSRMVEFRKQLKTRAIQAAKEKGIYLTESINEKLGEAITIQEPAEFNPYIDNNNASMRSYSQTTLNSNVSYEGDKFFNQTLVDFRKIKMRFEVTVIFALK